MWRKIHSNRDPRDTVYSELKKEFRPYFQAANDAGIGFVHRHPRFLFGGMVALMFISAVLGFTVFRRHNDVSVRKPAAVHASPLQDGISQILKTAGDIRLTIALKHRVDSLTAKKELTAADSLSLDSTLNQLQRIHGHANQLR